MLTSLEVLEYLTLGGCTSLRGLPDGIYKLQQLQLLGTPTVKLRPLCNSFDSSSGYGFLKLVSLDFWNRESIIELDLLMKPDYFPALEKIDLTYTNIITIPESISRFPRLKRLYLSHCKHLREIQGLPLSIRTVGAEYCPLLDNESLWNQAIEIMGILRNGVCGSARSNELMDPQFTDYFPSETEGAQSESESEDGDIDRTFEGSGTEIPWFNHQSVEHNSILFWVGRKFPKLALYIAFGVDEAPDKHYIGGLYCFFYISINGCKKRECKFFGLSEKILLLYSPRQSFLQQKLNESNPTNQNLVEVTLAFKNLYGDNSAFIVAPYPIRWGVHVECICPPQESKSHKVGGPRIPNLPLLTDGHDDVDYWSELPFYGSDDLEAEEDEEYQSPLVLNDTSRSCMSWLVGPITMLFKLFCFCCPRDI